MTIKDLVWDLRTLLRQLTDDSSVMDKHLIHKLNMYRALFINSEYNVNTRLDEEWFQRLTKTTCTPVNSGDDPDIEFTTVKFGKLTIPRVIELPEMISLKVYMPSIMTQIFFKDRPTLNAMIKAKDYRLKIFRYITTTNGSEYLIYPFTEEVVPEVILYDPLDGYSFNTEYGDISSLNNGSAYKIISGSLSTEELGVVYKRGDTFTANVNYTYTGNGKVRLVDQILPADGDYRYPIGADMAQRIIIEILTKDFQIERNQVFDVINDSLDQLKLIYSELGKGR